LLNSAHANASARRNLCIAEFVNSMGEEYLLSMAGQLVKLRLHAFSKLLA
jgi:hypothetical protein